jgi:hypothetical protein
MEERISPMTLIICLINLILPVFFWSIFYSSLRGRVYEMDWGSSQGSFFAPYALYRRIYWVIFSLSLVGTAFFAHTQYTDLSFIFLGAVVYALLFNGWTAYCYEAYLHARYPHSVMPLTMQTQQEQTLKFSLTASNYGAGKYAVTLAFAISSLLLFLASLCLSTVALIER